jgi:Protein of unknown function (DUF3168)
MLSPIAITHSSSLARHEWNPARIWPPRRGGCGTISFARWRSGCEMRGADGLFSCPAPRSDEGPEGRCRRRRHHPSRQPLPTARTFPFGRYGAPQTTPFRLSGLSASSHRFTYHAFVNGLPTRTAEDRAYDAANAIQAALEGRNLPLEGGMHATVSWLGSNCLIDRDEPTNWHAVINFAADVAG